MSGNRPARAAIYTRLSTEEQVRGEYHSLEHQAGQAAKLVPVERWGEPEIYEDRGISGGRADRPAWLRLQADIRKGKIKRVVTYKLERLCRDAAEGLLFMRLARDHGCEVISATEPLDMLSAVGRLSTTMLFGMAEFERNNNSQKVKSKQKENALRGYKNGGIYPLGYVKSERPGVPRIEEDEAKIVRLIFELFAAGWKLRDIADELGKRGMRTRRYAVKRKGGEIGSRGGVPFRTDTLSAIVREPMYKGLVVHGEIESKGKFEPLVPEELWAAANARLRPESEPVNQSRVLRKPDRWVHPLKGILQCGACGGSMTPHASGKKDASGKPYRYYSCVGSIKGRCGCNSSIYRLPATLIEDLVFEYLGEVAGHPSMIAAICGAADEGDGNRATKLSREKRGHERKLKKLNGEIANLKEVALKMGATGFSEDLMREAEVLQRERESHLAQIHFCQCEIDSVKSVKDQEGRIREALKEFGAVVRSLPPENQRELVRLMMSGVRVDAKPRAAPKPGNAEQTRKLRLKIDLRVGSLLKSADIPGGLFAVVLDVTLHRGRALWAESSGKISLEVRRPEPAVGRRKGPRKERHEIHRADEFAQKMRRQKLSAARLASHLRLSRAGVHHVLQWHELTPACQTILRKLDDPTAIRKASRSFRRKLLILPRDEQLAALKERLK